MARAMAQAEVLLGAIRRRDRPLLRFAGVPLTTTCANGKPFFENMLITCEEMAGTWWWFQTQEVIRPLAEASGPRELLTMLTMAAHRRSNTALYTILQVARINNLQLGSAELMLAYLLRTTPPPRDTSVIDLLLDRLPRAKMTAQLAIQTIKAVPGNPRLIKLAVFKSVAVVTPAVVAAAMMSLSAVTTEEVHNEAMELLHAFPEARPTLEDLRGIFATRQTVFFAYANRYAGVVPAEMVDDAIANKTHYILSALVDACARPVIPMLLELDSRFEHMVDALPLTNTLADGDRALILAKLRQHSGDPLAERVRSALKAFFGVDADGKRGLRFAELVKMLAGLSLSSAKMVIDRWFRRFQRPSAAAIEAGRVAFLGSDVDPAWLCPYGKMVAIRSRLFGSWRLRDHALHDLGVQHRVVAVLMVERRLRVGAPLAGRPMLGLGAKLCPLRQARIVARNSRGLEPLPLEMWYLILEMLPGCPLESAFTVIGV